MLVLMVPDQSKLQRQYSTIFAATKEFRGGVSKKHEMQRTCSNIYGESMKVHRTRSPGAKDPQKAA